MNITVVRERFFEILQKSSYFISSKINDIKVLKGVLIEANKNGVYVKTTNISEYFQGEIGGKVTEEGSVLVDFKVLYEVIRNVNESKIEINKKGSNLEVISTSGVVKIPLFTEENFPTMPKVNEGIEVDGRYFESANLKKIVFSTATDDTRPILTGVCFDFLSNETRLVGTDGFRMSLLVLKNNNKQASLEERLVIPSRSLSSLDRVFSNDLQKVLLLKKENKIVFSGKGIVLVVRLIDGEYPPYEKVIPKDEETECLLKTEDLKKALKTTQVFARGGSNMLLITVSKNSVEFLAKSQGLGEANYVVNNIEKSGKDNKITLNHRFLAEFSEISEGGVVFKLINPFSPVIFSNAKNKNYQHIIMPIRTQK